LNGKSQFFPLPTQSDSSTSILAIFGLMLPQGEEQTRRTNNAHHSKNDICKLIEVRFPFYKAEFYGARQRKPAKYVKLVFDNGSKTSKERLQSQGTVC
jgi:hypothetical protein